jgi:hypothetical protein
MEEALEIQWLVLGLGLGLGSWFWSLAVANFLLTIATESKCPIF